MSTNFPITIQCVVNGNQMQYEYLNRCAMHIYLALFSFSCVFCVAIPSYTIHTIPYSTRWLSTLRVCMQIGKSEIGKVERQYSNYFRFGIVWRCMVAVVGGFGDGENFWFPFYVCHSNSKCILSIFFSYHHRWLDSVFYLIHDSPNGHQTHALTPTHTRRLISASSTLF